MGEVQIKQSVGGEGGLWIGLEGIFSKFERICMERAAAHTHMNYQMKNSRAGKISQSLKNKGI